MKTQLTLGEVLDQLASAGLAPAGVSNPAINLSSSFDIKMKTTPVIIHTHINYKGREILHAISEHSVKFSKNRRFQIHENGIVYD